MDNKTAGEKQWQEYPSFYRRREKKWKVVLRDMFDPARFEKLDDLLKNGYFVGERKWYAMANPNEKTPYILTLSKNGENKVELRFEYDERSTVNEMLRKYKQIEI